MNLGRREANRVQGLYCTRKNSTPQVSAAEIELLCSQGKLRDALSTLGTTDSLLHPHTYKCLLQCCTASKALEEGQALHALILTSPPISIAPLESTLVYMYLQCDRILDARHIFDRMAKWDVFVWNVMIAAHTRNGDGKRAFHIFAAMEKALVPRDEITYVNILKTCKFLGDLALGRWNLRQSSQISFHGHANHGRVENAFKLFGDLHLQSLIPDQVMNSLLDMYAKCGCMDDGFQVFSRFHDKDVVTWTTIISGYARQACASVKSLEKGRLIHVYVVQSGLELDAFMPCLWHMQNMDAARRPLN
ncbi:hypothetical protein GOP47_0006077 [Adiantum capillus-veneris]|uniref:Pentatricopeptide repeat-containing protein n=1 Tax=Adiantum capillus-veneris TaxID=13818 RepID=A0A9D4V266_ADICA|nr:hypothetical protein GOP47_0006077 [Adiantum capillus-veneris]